MSLISTCHLSNHNCTSLNLYKYTQLQIGLKSTHGWNWSVHFRWPISPTTDPSDNLSLSLSLGFPTVIVASCHVTWQSCISDIMSSLLGRGNPDSNIKLNLFFYLYSSRTRYLLIMFGINMLHRNAMKHPELGDDSDWKQHNNPHVSTSLHLRLPSGFLLVPVLHPPQVVPNGLASATPPNAAKCVGLIGVNIPKVSGSRNILEQLYQNIPRNQVQLKMFW